MSPSIILLGAAASVAILHSILPDHWVPLAVVARIQRWNLLRVARVSALASAGHVLASLLLGAIIALIGLQFQHEFDLQQGHIIGAVLVITGLGFLIWGLFGGGHGHSHANGHAHDHGHSHEHEGEHEHTHEEHTHEHLDHAHDEHTHEHHDHKHATHTTGKQSTLAGRLSAIVVPFGVAASPDLTILPVVLAASAISLGTVVGVLSIFSLLTIATFVILTIVATVAGYQIKAAGIEEHSTTITSLVLIAIGIVAFVGF